MKVRLLTIFAKLFWTICWVMFGRFGRVFGGVFRRLLGVNYSKTLNNRPEWANNESRGGTGAPGTGFCSSEGGFLVLVTVVACH